MSSSPKKTCPLIFKWATFCREVLNGAVNQEENTLVGVLTSLHLAVDTVEPLEIIELPMVLWVHARFDFAEPTDTERNYQLSVLLTNAGREPVVKILQIVQKPKQEFLSANLHWPMNVKELCPKFREGRNFIKMSFRYKKTDLGILELPVDVTFKQSEKL